MIRIHNVNMNVVVKGEGKPIVLLHGWGQNQYMMKFLQDALCTTNKVVNLDLPGFGESEEPPVVWDVDDYVDCMYALMANLQIEKPIFIAHSFGARIALRYALRYPADKMILTGAAGIRKKHHIDYYVRVYMFKLLKKMHIAANMGSIDYQNASPVMRGVLVASVQDDIRKDLKLIRNETLLVWGERDKETPLWMGRVMETQMPNATLILLEKEDHFAYFYQSFRFTRICEAFLHG